MIGGWVLQAGQSQRNGQKQQDSVDVHMLLDFLRKMHSNKEAEATHLKNHLDILDKDIQQVRCHCRG